ncbi:MAG: hypothetical protein AMJ78_04210 [Omnitrophica WOR_2 bacterium SM23_29]|nr:MAG: hypothetical protein AMJ78_04210 [Omnitrophica WOR_2 bacterium SM23_29]
MRSIIIYHVDDKSLADDIFQDFFLSLATRPIPKNVKNIKAYLYRSITNDIIDIKRGASRRKARIYKYAEHSNYDVMKNNPEQILVREEEFKKMFTALEKHVTRSEAKALKLRYREGRDISEVAVRMKIKPRSVSRYLSIGINKIRKAISSTEKSNDNY